MRKKTLIIAILTSIFAVIGIIAGISFAAFEPSAVINKSNDISSQGRRDTQIFLGRTESTWSDSSNTDALASIWMCKWNSYNENYYAWEKQQAATVTISGGQYLVFDFDTTLYNSFSFHRIPDACATAKTVNGKVCFTVSDRNKNNTNTTQSGEDKTNTFYNATHVLNKPAGKNCYTIKSATTAGNMGFLSGGDWDDTALSYTEEYTPIEYAHSPEFDGSKYYVVGTGNYSTGSSAYGSSWYDASEAKIMTLYEGSRTGLGSNPSASDKWYKATINFTGIDQFRVRTDSWPKPTYENAGAILSGAITIDGDGNNLNIVTTGSYDIYFKVLTSSYSVFIQATPA